MVIRAPQVVDPGRVSDAFVEAIDIYPTLIDLAQPFSRKHITRSTA